MMVDAEAYEKKVLESQLRGGKVHSVLFLSGIVGVWLSLPRTLSGEPNIHRITSLYLCPDPAQTCLCYA